MTSSDQTSSPIAASDDEAAAALERARNTRRIINAMLLGMGGVVLAVILYGLIDMAQVIISAR